jgi:putative ABC transport system ATP-binding protein
MFRRRRKTVVQNPREVESDNPKTQQELPAEKIGKGVNGVHETVTNHNPQITIVDTKHAGMVSLEEPQGDPLIEIKQVKKAYKTAAGDFWALKGLSFNVYPGEFVGIIGKSGAGKSTLLNIITGVDQLTTGEVIIRSDHNKPVSIHQMSQSDLALWRGLNIGVIYQSFQLLPMLTLVDNVMIPMDLCGLYRSTASREKAMNLLRMVEIEEHAQKLPAYISGGQQQRVAIARALANDPPILIADEPTGSLDSNTAETIFEIFEELIQRGKTIIMVTHDNNLAPRFTRRIILADGEIVEMSSNVRQRM